MEKGPGRLWLARAEFRRRLRSSIATLSVSAGRPGLLLLEREFLPALGNLQRFGAVSAEELYLGQLADDLLQECICVYLTDSSAALARRGDGLRMVGRVAYHFLQRRKHKLLPLAPSIEAKLVAAPSQDHESEHASDLAQLHADLENNPDVWKPNGTVHKGRAAELLGVATKTFRLKLRGLAEQHGRDRSHLQFWMNRLVECLVQWLQELSEGQDETLLRSTGRPKAAESRLSGILRQLGGFGLDPEKRDALQTLRKLARQPRSIRKSLLEPQRNLLRDAAILLASDPFPIYLADVEWWLGKGEPRRALEALDELPPSPVAQEKGARPRPLLSMAQGRRVLLRALARARCLERLGRLREALLTLEALPRSERRRSLPAYNRAVLARRLRDLPALSQACADLKAFASKREGLPPLLRTGISRLLREAR